MPDYLTEMISQLARVKQKQIPNMVASQCVLFLKNIVKNSVKKEYFDEYHYIVAVHKKYLRIQNHAKIYIHMH